MFFQKLSDGMAVYKKVHEAGQPLRKENFCNDGVLGQLVNGIAHTGLSNWSASNGS